jgi:hypothetical protein
MPLRVVATPLVPKRSIVDPVGLVNKLDRELVSFSGAVIRNITDYPPVKPWKRGFPKSGPRRGGRRTGRYGRMWRLRIHRRGTFVETNNPVVYAVFVGGPKRGAKGQRQARFMGPRGWRNMTDVTD